MILNNKIRFVLFLLLLTSVHNIIGQNLSSNSKNGWYFDLKGTFISPLKITPNDSYLNSRITPSFAFSTGYFRSLTKSFGISFGGGFGMAPHAINYYIEVPKGSILFPEHEILDHRTYEFNNKYFSLSVLLHFLYALNAKWEFEIAGGVNGLFFSEKLFESYVIYKIEKYPYEVYYFDYYLDNYDHKNQASIVIQVYLSRLLKKDKISFGLTLNYTPGAISKGEYYFYEIGEEIYQGKLEQSFNYLGVSVRYLLGFNVKKN